MAIDDEALKALLLTDAEALDCIERVRAWANDRLAEATESLNPVIFVVHKDRPEAEAAMTVCVVASNFNEHEEKHALLNRLGQKFYSERQIPVMVAMGCEAWRSQERIGAPHIEPRHDPARVEIVHVMAMAMGRDGLKCWFTGMVISRDQQNRIVPSTWDEVVQAESPLLASFFRGFFKRPMEMVN